MCYRALGFLMLLIERDSIRPCAIRNKASFAAGHIGQLVAFFQRMSKCRVRGEHDPADRSLGVGFIGFEPFGSQAFECRAQPFAHIGVFTETMLPGQVVGAFGE